MVLGYLHVLKDPSVALMVAPSFVRVVADEFICRTPLKLVAPEQFLLPVNSDNHPQAPVLPNLYFALALT